MTEAAARRPRRSTRRGARLASALSGAAALLLSTLVLWQSAYAGFTAGASPLAAQVSTATLTLTDSDMGYTAVGVGDLKPGDVVGSCITVTSTGSVPTDVKLFGDNRAATASLDRYITVNLQVGTGGNSSCAGFTSSATVYHDKLSSFPRSYAAGPTTWTTTGAVGGESRTYRIVISLDANAPASTQASSAQVRFVWETRTS